MVIPEDSHCSLQGAAAASREHMLVHAALEGIGLRKCYQPSRRSGKSREMDWLILFGRPREDW